MSIIATFMVAQAIMAADLQPSRFYVSGIYQGMSIAEYNSMISNGRYRSQPVRQDVYWANISGRDVFVSFCEGKVFRTVADYRSSEWIESIQNLQQIGFRFSPPIAEVKKDEIGSSSLVFGATMPKGYQYGIVPMVKGTVVKDRDMPSFQLMFQALGTSCT